MFELYSVPSFPTGQPEIIAGKEVGSNKQLVSSDSVLLCKINPRINRAWVVGNFSRHTKIALTEWIVFPPDERVEPKFLSYFLRQNSVRDFLASNVSGVGGSLMRVKPATLRDFPFAYPERSEQRTIVAEIEKQFSRLDEAVASLKRTKANLKRYKAAVLKAAVEGKLTANWRKQHPDVEPASKLLERILTERCARWSGRGQYNQPGKPETNDLPRLPSKWLWARLDAIASLKGGITVDKNRKAPTARTVPYLRVANVQRGYLDLSEIKTIVAPDADIKDLRLLPGDILFNEGGDRDKLGRGWIWEGQLPECIHQNHVFRARLYSAQVSPKLVSWWGNSFGQAYFLREGKQTTNLASLNLTKLSAFPIPFPPTAEQQQIVVEVERRLSVIDELEATVEANLTRANRLRQSILSDAFSGRLVRQGTEPIPNNMTVLSLAAESRATYGANAHAKGEHR
jgi:type I restriction enzyme S subunit